MEDIDIRDAKAEDCKNIVELIKELAAYENMIERVHITEDVLLKDGFGEEKFFHAVVAEQKGGTSDGEIVGVGIFYYAYSTWEGRQAHLEDFIVKQQFRNKGLGSKMIKAIAKIVLSKGCSRLNMDVLSWNTPSIGFYKKLGMVDLTEKESWHLFRLNKDQMIKLSES